MTNKERLEANNKRIDEILQNLENKIIAVVEGKEIVIDLPENLRDTSSIAYVKINENKLLISGEKLGLYEYTIDSKTLNLLYMPQNSYKRFSTFRQVSATQWIIVGAGVVSADMVLYNSQTSAVKKLNAYSNFNRIYNVRENKVALISSYSSSSFSGIYLLDLETEIDTKIYDNLYSFYGITDVGEDLLIMGTETYPQPKLYNKQSDNVETLPYEVGNLSYFGKVSNLYVFKKSNIAYLYNSTNKTFSILQEFEGLSLGSMKDIGNNMALIIGTSSDFGLFSLNATTEEVIRLKESGYWNLNNFYELDNFENILLYIGDSNNLQGLFSYNKTTNTMTTLIETGYFSGSKKLKFSIIDDNYYFAFNSGTPRGVIKYSPKQNTAEIVSTTSNFVGCALKVSETKIIFFFPNLAPVIYNPNDGTTSNLKMNSSWYANYDVFEKDNLGNYYLKLSENQSSKPNIPYYNSITDEVLLGKYYIGEI